MNLLQAIILGIVQGLTEFIPVSSSAHLAIANRIMGIEDGNLMFFMWLHIATLLSIFTVFAKELFGLFKKPKMLGLIALASIPAVIFGALLRPVVSRAFGDISFVGFFLILTAIILMSTELLAKHKKSDGTMLIKEQKGEIGIKTALIMGFCQAGALFPGISRSGSTVSGGLLSGGNRQKVAKFSFFMSIPVILGATVFEAVEGFRGGYQIFNLNIAFGMLAAYLSGVLAVILLLKLIVKVNFKWFALYLVIAGIVITSLFLFVGI